METIKIIIIGVIALCVLVITGLAIYVVRNFRKNK